MRSKDISIETKPKEMKSRISFGREIRLHDHTNLRGKHAIFNPSNPSWLNYDSNEKVLARYSSDWATTIGTMIHAFAERKINKKILLDERDEKILYVDLVEKDIPESLIDVEWFFPNVMHYVNDAINYRMLPEVVMYYSDNFFGTCDAWSFDDGYLRIHDLKTGRTPAHMEQLEIYAAFFCLEYGIKPSEIETELRIYQAEEVVIGNPDPKDISAIMKKVVSFDKYLKKLKAGEF